MKDGENMYNQSKKNSKYCIHCKKPSGNLPFCYECYNKYYKISEKSSKLINESTNQQTKDIKPKRTYTHNSTYKLNEEIEVKSKSELLISNFLQRNRIKFEYEKPLYYDKEQKPLYPDFYIEGPRYFKGTWLKNIYIEHFGGAKSNNAKDQKKYNEITQYKIPIYQKLSITVICTYEEDIENLDFVLTEKLKNYQENKINYLKKS